MNDAVKKLLMKKIFDRLEEINFEEYDYHLNKLRVDKYYYAGVIACKERYFKYKNPKEKIDLKLLNELLK